jgi:hypothetical protein
MTTSYETHSLVAGAYKGSRVSARSTLTHAVRCEEERFAAVLCGGVDLDSVSDCEEDDVHGKPTCQKCARKDPRWSTANDPPREHKTSVGGRDYVLHIADGDRTLCGRLAERVNCDRGTATDEEICRACLRKRQHATKAPQ